MRTAACESIGFEAFRAALLRASERLCSAQCELNQLDSAGGDGDLGTTLATGFAAASPGLADWDEPDTGATLMHVGAHLGQGTASMIGELLNTALVQAGREVIGVTELHASDVAMLLRTAADAVARRSLVTVGERTVVDAMEAAATAAEQACRNRLTAVATTRRAAAAAQAAPHATAGMALVHGHASQTVGPATRDAGAAAWALFLTAIAEALE